MKNKVKYGGQIFLIPLENIKPNPDTAEKSFDEAELMALAQSITESGLLRPISVHRTSRINRYEIISGEESYIACKMAGLYSIPCVVLEAETEKNALLSLIENIRREDLSFFEEARAINDLMISFGFSQEEMAKRLGRSQSALCNKLRLLRLPPDVCFDIERCKLSERHARALLKLETDEQIREVLSCIVQRHLSVSQTDKLIEKMINPVKKIKKTPAYAFKDLRIFVNTLNYAVEKMNNAGITASTAKSENEEYIEYTVTIAKYSPSKPGLFRQSAAKPES